ncbi:MAG: hypothetical protein RIS99_582, partial [Bacteroidota bacterium]
MVPEFIEGLWNRPLGTILPLVESLEDRAAVERVVEPFDRLRDHVPTRWSI